MSNRKNVKKYHVLHIKIFNNNCKNISNPFNYFIKKMNPVYFSNFAYIESKIPDDILTKLKEESDYILKNESQFNKSNKKLIGQIKKEYDINHLKNNLKSILFSIANECHFHLHKNKNFPEWDINSMWMNFQKKHEYNPLHNHSGILSFVIWIKIPYDIKKELNLPNSKDSSHPSNSLFQFTYTHFLGNTVDSKIYVDKSYEGTIIMFPSSLNHMVYPFYTSDDYRISVAGNLMVNTTKNNNFSYK